MLIVYNVDGSVVSVSGYRGNSSDEMIEKIKIVDGLFPGQSEYRIYDRSSMDKVWAVIDAGLNINKVIFDQKGRPVGLDLPEVIKAAVDIP